MIERELFGRLAETEMSPGEYYKTIRQLNDLFQRELSENIGVFEDLLGSGIVVSATGSDVRREKGSAMSPLNFSWSPTSGLILVPYKRHWDTFYRK